MHNTCSLSPSKKAMSRDPKSQISCTRVQCTTFNDGSAKTTIFVFRSVRNKNPAKLLEDIEYLLPVKFHQISFNGSRVEVEDVLANQRPEQPS